VIAPPVTAALAEAAALRSAMPETTVLSFIEQPP
jgi:hypothetical protein